jgi:hypothetical protein
MYILLYQIQTNYADWGFFSHFYEKRGQYGVLK